MLLFIADASPCYLMPRAQVWVGMDKEVGGWQPGLQIFGSCLLI